MEQEKKIVIIEISTDPSLIKKGGYGVKIGAAFQNIENDKKIRKYTKKITGLAMCNAVINGRIKEGS